jgi:hypothetical protein
LLSLVPETLAPDEPLTGGLLDPGAGLAAPPGEALLRG